MGGLDRQLARAGVAWRPVEMTMASSVSRELFRLLQAETGHRTLPQVFRDGRFIGGIETAREALQRETSGEAPAAALWLGYLGLVPFAASALGVWLDQPGAMAALAGYAAVILSFVGAIHWGLASAARVPSRERLIASVLPALVAWVALLLPQPAGVGAMAVAFVAFRVWEQRSEATPMPAWLSRLRSRLTAGATLALLAGGLALLA